MPPSKQSNGELTCMEETAKTKRRIIWRICRHAWHTSERWPGKWDLSSNRNDQATSFPFQTDNTSSHPRPRNSPANHPNPWSPPPPVGLAHGHSGAPTRVGGNEFRFYIHECAENAKTGSCSGRPNAKQTKMKNNKYKTNSLM